MDHLQKKLRDLEANMFQQGILDDQFTQLQKLQDDSSPDFVHEVITLYFADSDNLLANMAHALLERREEPVNFKQIDAYAHQQKGSSASVGAARVTNICAAFRSFCEAKNLEGCRRCLQELQKEYDQLKRNLQYLFKLQQEIKAFRRSIPTRE